MARMTDAPDLQPTSDTMRAALLTGIGGPEMMQLGETAIPSLSTRTRWCASKRRA